MGEKTQEIPQDRKRIAGFGFGVLLALLPVAAGYLLNPSSAVEFTGGRYELLAIGLFVGFSTGHYIGLSLGMERDANLYAAIGAFLTISVAYSGLAYAGTASTGTLGAIGVLVIAMLLLILGHYSGVIAEKEKVARLTKQFAETASPFLLSFIWLLEAILPPIFNVVVPVVGLAGIGSALIEGLKWGVAIVVAGLAWTLYTSWTTDRNYRRAE